MSNAIALVPIRSNWYQFYSNFALPIVSRRVGRGARAEYGAWISTGAWNRNSLGVLTSLDRSSSVEGLEGLAWLEVCREGGVNREVFFEDMSKILTPTGDADVACSTKLERKSIRPESSSAC